MSHPGESKCRISLLGADHTKPIAEYATVECIQRSEVPPYRPIGLVLCHSVLCIQVYGYACSLNDLNFCCSPLQVRWHVEKSVYIARVVTFGFFVILVLQAAVRVLALGFRVNE